MLALPSSEELPPLSHGNKYWDSKPDNMQSETSLNTIYLELMLYSLYFDKTIRTSKLFYKTAILWTKQLKYALKQNAEAMYTLNVSQFYFLGGVGLNHFTSSGRCFTKGIQDSLWGGWFRTHKKLFKGQYTQGNKSFLRWNISVVDRTKEIIHREAEPNLSDTLLCQRISCG